MPELTLERSQPVSLCETLDRLLATGVVLLGGATISLAQIDLIYVGVQLVISSVHTGKTAPSELDDNRDSRNNRADRDSSENDYQGQGAELSPSSLTPSYPVKTNRVHPVKEITPGCEQPSKNKEVEGLAKLVLTVMKLLHELLERQGIRRIESGSLSLTEIERLGLTLMKQTEALERLRKEFGFQNQDLNLDLGPLGKLL